MNITYQDELVSAPDRTHTSDLTLFSDGPTETKKSNVTSPTTNDEFLRAVFQGLAEPLRPFVLGLSGNPQARKGSAWGGRTWHANDSRTDDRALNWYFTLAVYRNGGDGNAYYRREKDCAAIYGVMLDDLGTKALPLDRLNACPPSYVVETSDGNFQAGYLFTEPVTDLKSVTDLNESMVAAGLCDPGAKTPTTRYGRLPFASNGKTDPAFACRLVQWNPERRYIVAQIMDGLELAPPEAKTRHKATGGRKEDRRAEDGIYIPRPAENEVIGALKLRGLYKQPLGSGRHDVTCPWVHEHTGQVDDGSAYFEPSDLYPVGGFKCHHSHGDQYRVSALLDFLGLTFTEAKHKPTIRAEAGNIGSIADAGERELANTKRYYQRGGLIVSVVTDPETRETAIKPVSQPALLRALSSCAIWTRYDARSGNYAVIDPPVKHVNVLFDSEAYAHLPALAGIARQPHLRPDGSLVRVAGFDDRTGLFGVFDSRLFSIPDKPTREQALEALQALRNLLTEFEFSNAHDEAAALAGILTAAVRPSLTTAPMFHIRAPQIASGKSYLSGIIAAFASPSSPSAVAFPRQEEECQKLLLATLLTAPGAVVFDNLTTDLIPHKTLCSALTEEFLTGRILGVSKTATVGTRTLFLSSGNNVDAVKDMARRCVTIAIDPQVESPAARTFNGDPLTTVRKNRELYVSRALTLIRGWLVSGAEPSPCKPVASYGQWSQWVRQALLWLGLPDPARRIFEQMEQDPERETLGRLLHAWRAAFDTRPTMIREAVDRAPYTPDASELREVLREIAEDHGEINRRRLGRWIARKQGVIVDGLRFERASGTTEAERWQIKSIGAGLCGFPQSRTADL